MKPCKRIEIVVDGQMVGRVTELLRSAGVPGYTVIRDASGWGNRGVRQPDGVSGAFENCVVLCACAPEVLDAMADRLRAVLRRTGGVALVSDAAYLMQ